MNWCKRRISEKLSRELAVIVLLAFFLACGLYLAAKTPLCNAVCAYYAAHPEEVTTHNEAQMDDFSSSVKHEGIAASDTGALTRWVEKHPLLILQIYRSRMLIFDSTASPVSALHMHFSGYSPSVHQALRTVAFADGEASVSIATFPEHTAMDFASNVLLIVCVILFLSIVMICVRSKVRYLVQLEREILAIAGGDLSLPLTRRGSDELCMLAECVNDMRASLMEKAAQQDIPEMSDRAWMVSMAHDLRTPLTALMGYLEVLSRGEWPDEQKRYLEKCVGKALQVKRMSDQLFNHFQGDLTHKEAIVPLPVRVLLSGMITDSIERLQENGFDVHKEFCDSSCVLAVQHDALQRVLDNMLCNLERYADKTKPLTVMVWKEMQWVCVSIRSTSRNDSSPSGSGIGLTTCEALMESMGGTFKAWREGDEFVTELVCQIMLDYHIPLDT